MNDLTQLIAQQNELLARIAAALEAMAQANVQWTADGAPLCPKHGVPMRKREKQGDTWYSHTVTDANGQGHYCRGYASKSSPGWNVEEVGATRPPVSTKVDRPAPKAPAAPSTKVDTAEDPIFSYVYGDGQKATKPEEKAAFNDYRRANNERVPANVEALRNWVRNQQPKPGPPKQPMRGPVGTVRGS